MLAVVSPPVSPTPPPVDLLAPGLSERHLTTSPARARRARVAIIIDDVGSDLRPIELVIELPYRITFSIIPHLAHSREAAELLNRRGFEVMLHLPMEPLAYPRENPGQGAVLAAMLPDEIRRTVLRDLAAIPHVVGVNNHMGSRITSDPRRMRAVLEAVATTPYFFIDSRTAQGSIAFALARELSVPTAERAVFLDDDTSASAIRGQFQRLARIAHDRGEAIAIGHPHPTTIDALRRELRELVRQGIDVVFASELVS